VEHVGLSPLVTTLVVSGHIASSYICSHVVLVVFIAQSICRVSSSATLSTGYGPRRTLIDNFSRNCQLLLFFTAVFIIEIYHCPTLRFFIVPYIRPTSTLARRFPSALLNLLLAFIIISTLCRSIGHISVSQAPPLE
jgi:hypothetical protein